MFLILLRVAKHDYMPLDVPAIEIPGLRRLQAAREVFDCERCLPEMQVTIKRVRV